MEKEEGSARRIGREKISREWVAEKWCHPFTLVCYGSQKGMSSLLIPAFYTCHFALLLYVSVSCSQFSNHLMLSCRGSKEQLSQSSIKRVRTHRGIYPSQSFFNFLILLLPLYYLHLLLLCSVILTSTDESITPLFVLSQRRYVFSSARMNGVKILTHHHRWWLVSGVGR